MGHEGRPGLVAGHHRARAAVGRTAGDGVEQGFDGAAGHAPDVLHAELGEVRDQEIGGVRDGDGAARGLAALRLEIFGQPAGHDGYL